MKSKLTAYKFFLETVSITFFLKVISIALMFLCFSLIIINIINYISITTAPYDLFVKLKLFLILFSGSFQSVSGVDLLLLTVISILFGLNLGLVVRKYRFIKRQPNLGITIGSGIISLAAAGCASCGLSVMSLVGLGSALAILPFRGIELYIAAIIILSASLLYNLNALYKACKIN